jgi:hypothetical protein
MITKFTVMLVRYYGRQGSQVVKKAEYLLVLEQSETSKKLTNQRER